MDDMFVITDRDGRPVIRVAFLAPGYFVFHYPVEGQAGVWQATGQLDLGTVLRFMQRSGGALRACLFLEWLRGRLRKERGA